MSFLIGLAAVMVAAYFARKYYWLPIVIGVVLFLMWLCLTVVMTLFALSLHLETPLIWLLSQERVEELLEEGGLKVILTAVALFTWAAAIGFFRFGLKVVRKIREYGPFVRPWNTKW